ncbi:glycerol-3-phosphate 1-O-acyltransferase PlsY [Haploplasma axanthum]|nr:glycerol-3-phosphate 1-O-acyltransferase PlsY [Haploplasma axanthum]
MNLLIIIILGILSYLLGSIPSGYLIAKIVRKIDIRKLGSNSTGATNTSRVLGFKYGLLALFFDALKGIIIMAILVIFKLDQYYIVNIFDNPTNILAIYGLISVIGHIYPIFLNFKGGKAVATSFGVVLFLTPLLALMGVFILVSIVYITKYVSLASIITGVSIFLVSIFFAIFNVNIMKDMATPGLPLIPIEYAIVYGLMASIIILKHKQNIIRLISGEENKFSIKK